eukprot:scpid12153/ scgid14991/ 
MWVCVCVSPTLPVSTESSSCSTSVDHNKAVYSGREFAEPPRCLDLLLDHCQLGASTLCACLSVDVRTRTPSVSSVDAAVATNLQPPINCICWSSSTVLQLAGRTPCTRRRILKPFS